MLNKIRKLINELPDVSGSLLAYIVVLLIALVAYVYQNQSLHIYGGRFGINIKGLAIWIIPLVVMFVVNVFLLKLVWATKIRKGGTSIGEKLTSKKVFLFSFFLSLLMIVPLFYAVGITVLVVLLLNAPWH